MTTVDDPAGNQPHPSRLYRWINASGAAAVLLLVANLIVGATGIPTLLDWIPFATKSSVSEQFVAVNVHLDRVDNGLLSLEERSLKSQLSQMRRDELVLSEKTQANPGDIQGRDFLADLRGEIKDAEDEMIGVHCQMARRTGC